MELLDSNKTVIKTYSRNLTVSVTRAGGAAGGAARQQQDFDQGAGGRALPRLYRVRRVHRRRQEPGVDTLINLIIHRGWIP